MSILDEFPVALPLGQLPALRILAMNSRGLQRIDVVAADIEDGVTIATHRKWG